MTSHKYVTIDDDGMGVKEIGEALNVGTSTASNDVARSLKKMASAVLSAFDQELTNDRISSLAFNPQFQEIVIEAFRRNDAQKLQKTLRAHTNKDMIESITPLCGSHYVKPGDSEV